MRFVLFLFTIVSVVFGGISAIEIRPDRYVDKGASVRILDQKNLSFKQIGGLGFSEISDLAYDPHTQKLYLVADEGKLFTFKAVFGKTIETLSPIGGVWLTRSDGKPYKRWQRDSEGMCFGSRSGLLVSFEGDAKLRLFGYDGKARKEYRLPAKLQKRANFRSPNKSLESVALHPVYGALMVSEWALKQDDKKIQTIYSLGGREWRYRAEPERKSGTTAIEVTDEGNLLVVERSFIDLLSPFVVTLKKVYLQGCKERTICKSEALLKMNSHKGWDIDNFEGLTRVGKNRYVMVSDDNDNFFQKTLLIYFEVIPKK